MSFSNICIQVKSLLIFAATENKEYVINLCNVVQQQQQQQQKLLCM